MSYAVLKNPGEAPKLLEVGKIDRKWLGSHLAPGVISAVPHRFGALESLVVYGETGNTRGGVANLYFDLGNIGSKSQLYGPFLVLDDSCKPLSKDVAEQIIERLTP